MSNEDIKHFLFVIGAGLLIRFLWHYSAHNQPRKPDRMIQQIRSTPYDNRYREYREALPSSPKEETARTLYVMRALVHSGAGDPAVREAAANIVKGCAGHDFICEIKALFEFVRDRITYRKDPVSIERVQTARKSLEFGTGDCDDKVVLLCSLLAALGHKSRFVVIGYNRNYFSHVYLEALTRQGWMPLDPTSETAAMGWEGRGAIRQAYPVFT